MQLSYSSDQPHDHDHKPGSCQIDYDQCRYNMRNGDVLLFRGKGLASGIIQMRTKSPYSHAGIVSWWNRRLMVLEAVGAGVRAVPLSFLLKEYPGGVDYFQSTDNIDEPKRQQMVIFAQEQLGKAYNNRLLLRYAFKNLFSISFSDKDKVRERPASQYYCSQYVAEVYSRAGFDLQINLSDKYTSPAVLASCDKLTYVGTLKE